MFVKPMSHLATFDSDIMPTKNKYDVIVIRYINEVMIFKHRDVM
jgi:hypothetical protein